MSQRYNKNTKRPKANKNQLGILKIYTFCWKIHQRVSGPGESAAGFMYLSMRVQPKSCSIVSLKIAATLLSGQRRVQLGHSSNIVKVSVEATC